jgi:hypothetical protein
MLRLRLIKFHLPRLAIFAFERDTCSDILRTFSCDNPTTNCPPSFDTNHMCPILITNWYVVDHPGYQGSGEGWWADFTPTNCGQGSITFYGIYANLDPCTFLECSGEQQFSKKVDLNIVNVEIAERSKTVCITETTGFHLTNTCGNVTWEIAPTNIVGGPTISGSGTVTAGTNCGVWSVIARSTINTNCIGTASLVVTSTTITFDDTPSEGRLPWTVNFTLEAVCVPGTNNTSTNFSTSYTSLASMTWSISVDTNGTETITKSGDGSPGAVNTIVVTSFTDTSRSGAHGANIQAHFTGCCDNGQLNWVQTITSDSQPLPGKTPPYKDCFNGPPDQCPYYFGWPPGGTGWTSWDIINAHTSVCP